MIEDAYPMQRDLSVRRLGVRDCPGGWLKFKSLTFQTSTNKIRTTSQYGMYYPSAHNALRCHRPYKARL